MGKPPLRILLAEDDDLNRLVVRRVVERLGHHADVVADGLAALAAMQDRDYDVVLLDVQMPGMDGLEVVRRVRTTRPAGSPPWLIAFTGHASEAGRTACLAAGVDDYLAKPARSEELARALDRSQRPAGGRAIGEAGAPVPAATAAAPAVLDHQHLDMLRELGRQTGQDLLAALLGTYAEEAPSRLRELEESLAAGDVAEALRLAHSFKGVSANIGAALLALQLADFERCLGEGGDAQARLATLATEVARTLAELRRVAAAETAG